jgi:predicted nuclease with TOPRIM domain
MPSLQTLKDRVAAREFTPAERAYADQLLADLDAKISELVPLQDELTRKIAEKDAYVAASESLRGELRVLNLQRDPIAGEVNRIVKALGDLMGDALTLGG